MVILTSYRKAVAFIVAAFFHNALVLAQSTSDNPSPAAFYYDDLFLLPHFEVFFSPNINSRAKIERVGPAKYELQSAPQLSYEFGINKLFNSGKESSTTVGFHFGLIGRNSSFIVPAREVGLSRDGDYPFAGPISRERDLSFFSIPLQFEQRFLPIFKRRHFFFGRGGVSVRWAPLNNTSNADMDIMEVRLDAKKSPFVNFNIGGGYAIILPYHDILRLSLNFNYDPSCVAKGSFFLNTIASYDEGTYKVSGTSVGLHLVYARTKIRK